MMTTNTVLRPEYPGFAPPAATFRGLVKQAFTETLPSLGYTVRQAQIDYAQHVTNEMLMAPCSPTKAKVVGPRPNLGLIEGPTGIGKTQGYLIPPLLWAALATQAGVSQRTLISTHTLVLQDQIVGPMLRAGRQPSYLEGDRSDLAMAIEVVRLLTGVTLTAAFRKGKQAYIDAGRARKVLTPLTDDAEAVALLGWIETFPVRPDEEAGNAEHAAFRAQIQVDPDPCQGLLQSWLESGHELPDGIDASELVMNEDSDKNANPWYEAAKDNARTATVVVVTHTMVLVDLLANGRVLSDEGVGPASDFTFLIHDEADMLAGVAESFSRHKARPITIRGLLNEHRALFTHPVDDEGMGSKMVTVRDAVLAKLDDADGFLTETYNDFLEKGVFRKDDRVKEHPLVPGSALARRSVAQTKGLTDALRTLEKEVAANQSAMPRKAAKSARILRAGLTEAVSDLALFARILSVDDQKDEAGDSSLDYRMTALSWSPKKALASFEVLRLNPGRMFSRNWTDISQHRYVLLTSATLRVPVGGKASEWNYITNALGAHAAVNPQSYRPDNFGAIDRVYLSVLTGSDKKAKGPFLKDPNDLEDDGDDTVTPYNPHWRSLALFGVRRMAEAATSTECGLLLAPSYKDVDWLAEALGDDPAFWFHRRGTRLQDGILALKQQRARILITPAAWAGHNIRAAGGMQILRHVGILRLPYPPPDASLQACYEVMYRLRGKENPQQKAGNMVYMRTRALALHKFIQGIGRGIRATDDVMSLWIFDPRFRPHRDAVLCGDPRLFGLVEEAIAVGDMWHRAVPERFHKVLSDPRCVTLLIGRQDTGNVVAVTPELGFSPNNLVL